MLRLMVRMILRSAGRRARRTAVTFAGVAMATAALVVLGAVMVGVGDAMIRNSVALATGHVHVTAPAIPVSQRQSLLRLPHVRSVLPRKAAPGLLAFGDKQAAATVLAVLPAEEAKESVAPRKIVAGGFLSLPGEMVLGRTLAGKLGAKAGDEIQLSGSAGTRTFRVVGILAAGIADLDTAAWISLDVASGQAEELAVFLDSPEAADAVTADIRRQLGPAADVQTWRQALPELTGLIAINQVSMGVVLGLALLILAFGVSNTAFMSVGERTREIGILKAIGVRPILVATTVLAETFVVTLAAACLGVAVGAAASWLWGLKGLDLGRWTQANAHFLLSGVIYPRATVIALLAPAAVAAACGLLAGLLPAWRASRLCVIRALRWL